MGTSGDPPVGAPPCYPPHRGGLPSMGHPHRGGRPGSLGGGVKLLDPSGSPPTGGLFCYLVGSSSGAPRLDYPVEVDRSGSGSLGGRPGWTSPGGSP